MVRYYKLRVCFCPVTGSMSLLVCRGRGSIILTTDEEMGTKLERGKESIYLFLIPSILKRVKHRRGSLLVLM